VTGDRDPGLAGIVSEYRLDHDLVDAFLARALSARDENALAEQVARLLPFHATLPDRIAINLSRLTASLGGEHGLLDWLTERPGRPRLVAHLYRLIGLLDWYSADPAVVGALRQLRAKKSPLPPIVGAHLAPDTDNATLAGLAWAIEMSLGEDQTNKATRLAIGAAELLEQLARLASQADPSVGDLAEDAARLRAAIAEAHTEL
jgi:hypothetical protein